MPEFSVNTGIIHYQMLDSTRPQEDATPPLVLLHNFMSTGRAAWGPMLSELSRQFRIVLPDLPGHGRSIGHPPSFNHTVMAQQLAALLQAVGADRCHLAGCSSGGMIAQLMVHHHLVSPVSLTLVSSTHSVDPTTSGAAAEMIPENFHASRHWLQATAKLHDPYRYDGYYEEVLLERFRRLRPNSAIDLPLKTLAEWSLPVCLIHGEQDEFFPVNIARRMAQTLPNAQLTVVPNQSHALIFRQPWRVLSHMQEFLPPTPIHSAPQ